MCDKFTFVQGWDPQQIWMMRINVYWRHWFTRGESWVRLSWIFNMFDDVQIWMAHSKGANVCLSIWDERSGWFHHIQLKMHIQCESRTRDVMLKHCQFMHAVLWDYSTIHIYMWLYILTNAYVIFVMMDI